MAKRGRKKKFRVSFNISPETIRSVVAVFMILFGFVSFLSFIFPEYLVNAKIQIILKKAFGSVSILVPFIIALSGLLFIDALKNKIKELRIVLGLGISLFSVSGLVHLLIGTNGAKDLALAGKGGGFFGYAISNLLKNTLSIYGAFAVLLAVSIVALIVIFDVSFDRLIIFWGKVKEIISGVGQKGKKQDEIVVSGSYGGEEEEVSFPAESNSEKRDKKVKAPSVEDTFEVLPGILEPKDLDNIGTEVSTGRMSSVTPTLPYSDKVWQLPSLDLLAENTSGPPDTGDVDANKRIIKDTLSSFGITVEIVGFQVGPTVTKYELETPPGIKVAKISNLQYDLALALASPTGSVRIEAPIPGKPYIGIEVPNKTRATVDFRSMITSEPMKALKSKLGVVLGKDVGGVTHVYDIAKMPHILIAGATGSGKSVFIHNLIFSILYRATPQEVKFILVDPKRVELSPYKDIPHLYTPLVTDIEKAPAVFKWAVSEMIKRYKLFESAKARNIDAYNEKSGFQALPYIIIIVDELAEIMIADPASVEKSVIRLAQLARATGIHLILAAQRPSANVITGLIKANIPCRVAFNVTGQVDSRVIIDQVGAEKLLGKGDMLFVPPDKPNPVRLQAAWVSDKEIANVTNFLKSQGVPPEYKEEILNMPQDNISERSTAAGGDVRDPLYDEAFEIVVSAGKASASLLQRRLSIGYARAARILDELQEGGVVGEAQGSKPREVLVSTAPLPEIEEEVDRQIRFPTGPFSE